VGCRCKGKWITGRRVYEVKRRREKKRENKKRGKEKRGGKQMVRSGLL
jgi:hypothetical protein